MFYGWLIVFLVTLYQGLQSGLVNYSYGVIVVPLAEEFEPSRFMLMMGVTAGTLVSGLASPLLGPLVDKQPMRNLVALGTASLGVAFIALAGIQAIWQLPLIFAVFVSLSMAFMGPLTGSTLVSRWFERQRGRALGFAALGMSIGGFVLPPAMQFLIDAVSWRTAFFITGATVLLLGTPLFYFFIRSFPAEMGLQPDGAAAARDEGRSAPVGSDDYDSYAAVLKSPAFWMLGLSTGILYACFTGVLANIAPYAIGLGIDKTKAVQLISVIAIMGIVGKLAFGFAADVLNLKVSYWLSMLLRASGILILSVQPAYLLMILATTFIGLALGGMVPVYGSLLANVFGLASYGRVLGVMRLVTLPLSMMGPPAAGFIFDQTDSYTLAFQLFTGCLIFGALVIIPLRLYETE